MATSAATIQTILETMIAEKPADYEAALVLLGNKGLLPKKLTEVKKEKKVKKFASQAAEDYAAMHVLDLEVVVGTGNGGKITVSDLKKHFKPKAVKVNASPRALQFARDEGIDITTIEGSGNEGKIVLEDVKKLVRVAAKKKSSDSDASSDSDTDEDEDDLPKVTPPALKELKRHGLSAADCSGIPGSGKDGAIKMADIKELIAAHMEED